MDKVVVTAALTGGLANRDQCPGIPYTPEEIGEEARRAREAGAAVVHIHARERDGAPSVRVGMYREIMEAIRERTDILINFSTGAVGIPMEDRVAHIRDLRPEIGAVSMGSMNYAIYSPSKKTFYWDLVFANPFKDVSYLLRVINEAGVRPELECFDCGHIGNIEPLIDMGLLRPPLQFSLIMGVLGGIPATTRNLVHQVGSLPPGSIWEVIGVSLEQWRLVAAAVSLGGNVRVGFEDNFYLEEGQMARSNGYLVEKAARLCCDLGREVSTPVEARALLRLGSG
jgi:uncharacterized protein (DUF849 family)